MLQFNVDTYWCWPIVFNRLLPHTHNSYNHKIIKNNKKIMFKYVNKCIIRVGYIVSELKAWLMFIKFNISLKCKTVKYRMLCQE